MNKAGRYWLKGLIWSATSGIGLALMFTRDPSKIFYGTQFTVSLYLAASNLWDAARNTTSRTET